MLLNTDRGLGIVHDQDLDPLLLAAMIDENGNVIAESAFDELLEFIETGRPIPLWIKFRDNPVRLEPICAAEVPARFGFDPRPLDPRSPILNS